MHSDEVHTIATTNVLKAFESIHQYAILYTTLSRAQDETLPFATIADFEAFGAETRASSRVETIMFLPLLKSTREVARWNEYSQANTAWMTRSRLFQLDNVDVDDSNSEHLTMDNRISPSVYEIDRNSTILDTDITLPASPVWQMYVFTVVPFINNSRDTSTPVPKTNTVINRNVANEVSGQPRRLWLLINPICFPADVLEASRLCNVCKPTCAI